MDILREAHSILSQAGYQAFEIEEKTRTFFFEDSVLYGFVCVKGKPEEIETSWESMQDNFLSGHSEAIRHAREKAWNAYSVFLCSEKSTDEMRCSFLRIEEDFRGSRKIARGNVNNVEDLINSLLPLLPLKNVAAVESQDLQQRLKERMEISDSEFEALAGGENPDAFVQALLRAT